MHSTYKSDPVSFFKECLKAGIEPRAVQNEGLGPVLHCVWGLGRVCLRGPTEAASGQHMAEQRAKAGERVRARMRCPSPGAPNLRESRDSGACSTRGRGLLMRSGRRTRVRTRWRHHGGFVDVLSHEARSRQPTLVSRRMDASGVDRNGSNGIGSGDRGRAAGTRPGLIMSCMFPTRAPVPDPKRSNQARDVLPANDPARE